MNTITSWRPAEVLLYADEPPMAVMYSAKKIYAAVLSNGQILRLPVRGWPVQFAHSPGRLRKFFSCTWLKAEKGADGQFTHVQANLGLKGGMMGQADILPMYPGYALGGLITRRNLALPILTQRRKAIENELEIAYTEREAPAESKMQQEEKKLFKAVSDQNIGSLIKKYKDICDEITKQYKSADPSASVEETLPIDFKESTIITTDRSFQSEAMNHLIFSKDVDGNVESSSSIQKQVEKFVLQLFSQDTPSTTLSLEQVGGLVTSIKNLLKTEQKVSLVGSFITLPKVKVFDGIKLRKEYQPGKEILKHVDDYYVLTEAVLGAFFLGLGKYIATEEVNARVQAEVLMSRLAMISFISQGVIPKVSKDAHDVNLWTIYLQWKEALSDPKSGYPIGFRVRPLADVLKENHIELPAKDLTEKKDPSEAIPPPLPAVKAKKDQG